MLNVHCAEIVITSQLLRFLWFIVTNLSPPVSYGQAAQNFTMVNNGEKSPYTESNSSSICITFQKQIFYDSSIPISSIFIKILTSTHSNDCQIKTARSN